MKYPELLTITETRDIIMPKLKDNQNNHIAVCQGNKQELRK